VLQFNNIYPLATPVTDTRGNTYTRQATSGSSFVVQASSVVASLITTPLQAGDVITHNNQSNPTVVRADQFSGGFYYTSGTNLAWDGAPAGNQGSGTNPSASRTTTFSEVLLIGAVSMQGPNTYTATLPAGFTGLTKVGTSGGSTASNATIAGAYRVVAPGAYTYNPTITNANYGITLTAIVSDPALEPPSATATPRRRIGKWTF
jgi:hypothetical protein